MCDWIRGQVLPKLYPDDSDLSLDAIVPLFSLHSIHNDRKDTIPGERLSSIRERFDLWKRSQPSQFSIPFRSESLPLACGWHVPLFTGDRILLHLPTTSVGLREVLLAVQGILSPEPLAVTKTALCASVVFFCLTEFMSIILKTGHRIRHRDFRTHAGGRMRSDLCNIPEVR
jgi:hypothetical protein